MMRTCYGTCGKCKAEFPTTEWFAHLPLGKQNKFKWVCPGCGHLQLIGQVRIRVEDAPPEFVAL